MSEPYLLSIPLNDYLELKEKADRQSEHDWISGFVRFIGVERFDDLHRQCVANRVSGSITQDISKEIHICRGFAMVTITFDCK